MNDLPPPYIPPHDPLPSYSRSRFASLLPLLLPHLPLRLLPALRLVSRDFNTSLTPTLYHSPHLLFPLGDEPPFDRFKRFLASITRTENPHVKHLDLATLQRGTYGVVSDTWLRHLLSALPELETLQLPGEWLEDRMLRMRAGVRHNGLRRVVLRAADNVGVAGLEALLQAAPGLQEVEFAGTPAAGKEPVLAALGGLRGVRRVGLRGVGATDAALRKMLEMRGTGLHALDVGGNRIGDETVRVLLDWCVLPPAYGGASAEKGGRLEGEGEGGLTRLGIAKPNGITLHAVGLLLRTGRLSVLDIAGFRHAETLVPELSLYAYERLVHLRADASLVLAQEGLRIGMLKALKKLVVAEVPETAKRKEVGRLLAFVTGHWKGEVLLEMKRETEDVGAGDYSFFQDTTDGGGDMVRVIDQVKTARQGRKWSTRVRVVWDVGGHESREMGSGGERWGIVRDDA